MENIILNIIAILCAIISIIVTLVLRKMDIEREQKRRKQEQQELQTQQERMKLYLDVADELMFDDEKLYIKITNISQYANASNLVLDMRVENIQGKVLCEMKPLKLGRRQLLSKTQARDVSESEVVLVYDSKHILRKANNDVTSEQIRDISDIVKDSNIIKVKIQAINMEKGIMVFPKLKVFKGEKIRYGSFVEGMRTIQKLNQPTYIDHAVDS